MKNNKWLILPMVVISMFACKSDDDKSVCNDPCEGTKSELVDLDMVDLGGKILQGEKTIEGNCFKFNFTESGCNSDNWIVKMYLDTKVSNTSPPERKVSVIWVNPELCLAVFRKEEIFDLSTISNQGQVNLVFDDGTKVLYTP